MQIATDGPQQLYTIKQTGKIPNDAKLHILIW